MQKNAVLDVTGHFPEPREATSLPVYSKAGDNQLSDSLMSRGQSITDQKAVGAFVARLRNELHSTEVPAMSPGADNQVVVAPDGIAGTTLISNASSSSDCLLYTSPSPRD